jgi:hypothetical protein
MGQLLQSPDCYMSLFWNTINVYEGDGSVFNALMRDNTLSAIGIALTIWSRFLEDDMVKTSTTAESNDLKDTQSPSMVRCYASKTEGKVLNVILVNKDIRATHIELALYHLNLTDRQGEKWIYQGTSPTDKNPMWGKVGWIKADSETFATTLDPVSVTVFSFSLRPNSGLEEN